MLGNVCARRIGHDDLRGVLSPVFSPDGSTIVYSVSSAGGGTELFRIPVDGGEPVVLGRRSVGLRHAAISRDGRRLAYTDTRERSLLSRLDPADGQRFSLVDSRYPVFLPVVSADGTRVVYFSLLPTGAQLFSVNTDGTGLRQLTHDDEGVNTLPFWSDDGQYVYFYRDRSLHRLNLADGRDEQVIADFHWSSRNWAAVHGDLLAHHEFDRASAYERSAIRNLSDGTEHDLPVTLEGMRWSRDGRELLGFTRPPNTLTICVVETLRCSPLSAGGNSIIGTRPQWSPDEQSVYFLRTSSDGGCRRSNLQPHRPQWG